MSNDLAISVNIEKQGERAYSFCGTIEYMAPEVVKGGSQGHDKVNNEH